MAKKKVTRNASSKAENTAPTSSSVDKLFAAALDRGGDSLETGRYIVTFKEGAAQAGLESLTR